MFLSEIGFVEMHALGTQCLQMAFRQSLLSTILDSMPMLCSQEATQHLELYLVREREQPLHRRIPNAV